MWLMGVWQRSPAGIAIALSNDDLRASFEAALPIGKLRCRRVSLLRTRLRGRRSFRWPGGLASAREALAARGIGLILDFVPNHVAPDHHGHEQAQNCSCRHDLQSCERDPESFVEIDGRVLANGRDPYFPAWPDVVQLNAFAPALRAAVIETLSEIAEQCDGVRCDMAMLVMNDVFARTWGDRVGSAPSSDYWPTVIPAVREAYPGILVPRRGLLGSGVGVAAAGIQLLLRQATVRPDFAGSCRAGAPSSAGR